MLTRILHNSPAVCTFLEQLDLSLSRPQLQHVLNLVDGLLVCDSTKTLAALQRQFVECVDASNMADTLRIAPWRANDLRQPVGAFLLREALAQARAVGKLAYIAVSLDDSISAKHKNTRHLAGVDWHFDHVESTPYRPRFKNGLAYLGCNVWLGGLAFTFDVQPYLREKTVRRLNRQRASDQRIPFLSKLHLARRILTALQPLLPDDVTVYVLHDSWYASARLLKFTHRQNWHTLTALKFNRKLDHQRLDQHSLTLRHQRYAHVRVTATDGTQTSYCTRTLTGRLEDLPFDIRVIDSKRHPRAPRSAYFGCTDLSLEAQPALQLYGHRWGCETDNVYLHTRLGLGDFRMRPYEAVDKWVAVVHLALVYAQWRLLHERSPRLQCVADVIRQHRDEHLCDWLSGACQETLNSGDLNAVLQRFLRLDA
ncbi:MAG: transposase [Anaerolineae bacterium]|nr:transposase [Anaerolineae bacterium]